MSGKGKAKVWANFEKLPSGKVKCLLCKATLAYHGSTTSMREHAKRIHGIKLGAGGDKAAHGEVTCIINVYYFCSIGLSWSSIFIRTSIDRIFVYPLGESCKWWYIVW